MSVAIADMNGDGIDDIVRLSNARELEIEYRGPHRNLDKLVPCHTMLVPNLRRLISGPILLECKFSQFKQNQKSTKDRLCRNYLLKQ